MLLYTKDCSEIKHIIKKLSPDQKIARERFLDFFSNISKFNIRKTCPFCGSSHFLTISEIEGRAALPCDIVICKKCDGCYRRDVFTPESSEFYYKQLSHIMRGKNNDVDSIEKLFLERVNLYAYRRYHFIQRFVRLDKDRDAILEIGCNDGANLYPWKKNGYKVCGIEIDSRMAAFARSKGFRIIEGDFLKSNVALLSPRLIILSHMLEHVLDLDLFFKKLKEILKKDTLLFIEVPGIRLQAVGSSLKYFDIEHNFNFDLNSLRRTLKNYSFKMLYGDEYIYSLWSSEEYKYEVPHAKRWKSAKSLKLLIFAFLMKVFSLTKSKDLYSFFLKAKKTNFISKIYNTIQLEYFKSLYSYLESDT